MASSSKINFISDDAWEQSEKSTGLESAKKWIEVEQKRKFCVKSIEKFQLPHKTFETVIIHYIDNQGKVGKVFSPSHFLKDITSKRLPNYRPYFVSHGMQERNGNSVANFEIVYHEEEKDFDIFDHREEEN
jgi:hypothetical protein